MTTKIEAYLPEITPIVESIAADHARKFHRYNVERFDVAQELWVWVVSHPAKVTGWLDEEDGERPLVVTLRHEARRVCEELKAQTLGYSVDDVAYFQHGELKVLLDAVFDREAWAEPPVSEDGGGRSNKRPSEGGNWLATLADVSRAFDQLTPADQTLLKAFHDEGYSNVMLAELYDISPQLMSKKHGQAVARLHKLLGGERPRNNHDVTDCECSQYVGVRRAMSNATARAIQDNQYEETA